MVCCEVMGLFRCDGIGWDVLSFTLLFHMLCRDRMGSFYYVVMALERVDVGPLLLFLRLAFSILLHVVRIENEGELKGLRHGDSLT